MFLRWIHKIEPSAHCNRACEYCVNPVLGYPKGHMSMATLERVLYWTKRLNPTGQPPLEQWVHFRGIGEPLLNPNIVEMTAKMSDVARIWLSTNGDFLSEELLKELIKAKVSKISVSKHDAEVTARCEQLLKKYQVDYFIQDRFDDDWAGQLKDWEGDPFPCGCAHIETGGAMVIHNGDIITCCVDGKGDPVLGSVYDDEIRHIDIKPIQLCQDCRSNYYWKWRLFQEYSPTLSTIEKKEFFRNWINSVTPTRGA